MALIIPPGYLHAVYELTWEGDPETMVVTCGHEIDAASGATGEEAPSDLFNAFAAEMMTEMSSVLTLTAVDCYVGNDGPTPNVYSSTNAPVDGSVSGSLFPTNTAYLIRKRTDLAGRRGRGRMYVPGVFATTTALTGEVTSPQQVSWQSTLDQWMDALTTAVGARHYPPVILHRSEGAGVEPPPTPVARFVIDPKVATQRRRLRP